MEKKTIQQDWKLVAEIELVYKSNIKPSQRPKVTSGKEATKLFKKLWNNDSIELREEFKVMLLNRGCRVLGIYPMSTGGSTATIADPKLILAAAIKGNAASIIICHNHPSGNLIPSPADENITKKIKEGANLFDMKLLDHIIITSESYFSFADNGLL